MEQWNDGTMGVGPFVYSSPILQYTGTPTFHTSTTVPVLRYTCCLLFVRLLKNQQYLSMWRISFGWSSPAKSSLTIQ